MILHVNKKTLGTLLAAGCLLGASNRREFDHIGQFNFKVEIEGVEAGRFKAVDGLESRTEVIEFRDGENRILRLLPGRNKYGNIILKQGTIGKELFWNWRKTAMDGAVERKKGSIVLMNDQGVEVARYNFLDAWPSKWKAWDLDGKGGDVTAEEIELAVEKIERGVQ